MAAITTTAARVACPDPLKADVRSYIAVETITKGAAVCFAAAGTVQLASGTNASGRNQFRGIALNGGAAGQAIDVLHEGLVTGFTFAVAPNADAFAYLAVAPAANGTLDDAAPAGPDITVPIGRVVFASDQAATQYLQIFTQWEADWA